MAGNRRLHQRYHRSRFQRPSVGRLGGPHQGALQHVTHHRGKTSSYSHPGPDAGRQPGPGGVCRERYRECGSPSATTSGIGWSDHDGSGATPGAGQRLLLLRHLRHCRSHGGRRGTGRWRKTPTLVNVSPSEVADNHLNLKDTSERRRVHGWQDPPGHRRLCGRPEEPLMEFFRRTPAGVWSAHLVGTAGDCHTRPQSVDQRAAESRLGFPDVAQRGRDLYNKSAPLHGTGAIVFRGAPTRTSSAAPVHPERDRDPHRRPVKSKQPVTDASGIVVIANNLRNAACGKPNVSSTTRCRSGNGHDPPTRRPITIKGGSAHDKRTCRLRPRDRRRQRRSASSACLTPSATGNGVLTAG